MCQQQTYPSNSISNAYALITWHAFIGEVYLVIHHIQSSHINNAARVSAESLRWYDNDIIKDSNATAQLHTMSWPLGQISQKEWYISSPNV